MTVRQTVVSDTNSPKTMTFAKLKGVDYSSSPFEVSNYRSIRMKNMISKDGVNHKRPGWNETLPINKKICELGIDNILGIHYIGKAINNISYIVACSNVIYVFEKDLSYTSFSLSEEISTNQQVRFVNGKDFVLVFYESAIFKILLNTLTIEKIHSGDSYVPTTTISINPISEETSTREIYEYANLLNTKIKNSLLGKKQTEFNVMYFSVDYSLLGDIFKCITKQKITCKLSDGRYSAMELPEQIASFPLRSVQDEITLEFSFQIDKNVPDVSNKKFFCKLVKDDGTVLTRFTSNAYGYINNFKISELKNIRMAYEFEEV